MRKDKGDVNEYTASPSAIAKLDKWREAKHREHLSPQTIPVRAGTSTTTSTLPDGSSRDFQAAIMELASAITVETTRSTTTTKSGFDKLPSRAKRMLVSLV